LQYNPGTNGVELDTSALADATKAFGADTPRNVLAHELFHAFSNAHGGDGYSALDEGFGIAAREYAFTDTSYNLAEMVYGTMKAYRDGGDSGYQFGDFSKADPKLRELMGAFASRDRSQLAWNNPTQLQAEYTKYFEPLTRSYSNWNQWLADVETATRQMLADRAANRVPRPGHPVPI
ncbi:MAG TPA: hypothetical protein VND93_26210, partial [Myxococcales bacterium]|nr:hypothetical protein [Myxococcales bacterium]